MTTDSNGTALLDGTNLSGGINTGLIHDAGQARTEPRLTVSLARGAAEVEDAQRLRYKVFAEELGARVHAAGAEDGLDIDAFDAHCDHIIVRDEDSLRVVGTYRVLPPHGARAVGSLYSESEFDLARLQHLRPAMIEVGRSCVHRSYRQGSAIMLLWAGLAQYMRSFGYRHLIGCASASLTDGGMQAARLRDEMQACLSGPEYRVFPRVPFPHERIERAAHCEMPPLIKGYLRLGAQVCGEPAWDPDFNTADFLIWLSLDNLHKRYARHFDLLARQGSTIATTRAARP
jgi:putative hemolysin